MLVLTTVSRGPEGLQRVAHGASRGIEGHPEVISAPEGRQRLPNDVCRPSGAVNFDAAWRPTACAVGYSLTPLRGSRSPHTLGYRLCRGALDGSKGGHEGRPYQSRALALLAANSLDSDCRLRIHTRPEGAKRPSSL